MGSSRFAYAVLALVHQIDSDLFVLHTSLSMLFLIYALTPQVSPGDPSQMVKKD